MLPEDRRRRSGVSFVVVLALTAVGITVAAGPKAIRALHLQSPIASLHLSALTSHASAGRRQIVLRFIATNARKDRFHDVAPKGPSRGDTALSRMWLANRVEQLGQPNRSRVGGDSLTLRLTGRSSAIIRGFALLPGGSLIVNGALRHGAPGAGLHVSITGGTGAFKGAEGELYVNRLSFDSEEHDYTFTIPN
jgi:hypothetical protein